MANDIEKYCTSAWILDVTKQLDPSEDSAIASNKFNEKCQQLAAEEKKNPTAEMCFFVLNPNQKSKEKFLAQPMDLAVKCLVARAKKDGWVKFKDEKPSDTIPEPLPADATPADAKPATLPAGATPVDTKPTPLPADVTPADAPAMLGWQGMVSGYFGTAPTEVGISANGHDPLHRYRAIGYYGAALGVVSPEFVLLGTLAGRFQLDAVFEYMKFNPMQDQEYSREFLVVDLGPRVSFQGVYPRSGDTRAFFGPYVGYLMGGLSTDGAVEVEKGKGYDTDGKYSFITSLLYGLLVGGEKIAGRYIGFCQLNAGVRQFFWGAKPDSSNFPASMQIGGLGFSGMVSAGLKFK